MTLGSNLTIRFFMLNVSDWLQPFLLSSNDNIYISHYHNSDVIDVIDKLDKM